MFIQCPECHYAHDVPEGLVPPDTGNVRCPQCSARFPLDRAEWADALLGGEATEGAAATPGRTGSALSPAFHGAGSTLLGLYVMNYLLSILTLGIYYFWGKTKIRRYLYANIELMGERFGYHGTGKELFVGALKALVVLFLFFVLPQLLAENVHMAFIVLVYPALAVVFPFAMVSARRYRMSRSEWHGARFSFRGPAKEAIKIYVKGSLLTLLTLGVYSPYFHVQKEKFWRDNSWFGSERFSYSGEGRDLLWPWLAAMLLVPLTLGLYWFWYRALVARYDWGHTAFDGLKFRSTVTGGRLLTFKLGNLIILVLTLGIGHPWVVARKINFAFRYIEMEGEVDFEKVLQRRDEAGALGEGLLDQFDMDFGFGF